MIVTMMGSRKTMVGSRKTKQKKRDALFRDSNVFFFLFLIYIGLIIKILQRKVGRLRPR